MTFEIESKASGFDEEDGEFDATQYLHFINFGWKALE